MLRSNTSYTVCTKDAKHDYFLTADDLAELQYERLGGWGGWGNRRYYREDDLREAALRKYGVDGFREKRYRRAEREANKRAMEQKAKEAQARLESQHATIDLTDENEAPSPQSAAPAPVPVDQKALKALRKDVKRSFKPYMTWDHMRSKNAPNGTNVTARVMRVEQSDYCALIGKSNDPQLHTLVKKGAWYSVVVDFTTVFGGEVSITGSGGRYGSNSELGIDPDSKLTVKYAPSSKTLSVTGYVQHVDTFSF